MGAFGKMFTSWQHLLLFLLPLFTSGLPTPTSSPSSPSTPPSPSSPRPCASSSPSQNLSPPPSSSSPAPNSFTSPSPSSPSPSPSPSSPSSKTTSPAPSSPRPSPSPSSPSSKMTSSAPSSPRQSPSRSSQKPFSSPAPTPSPSPSPFPSSPRPTPSTGIKEKVEGDYEQTSPPSSNDWHFVKITAKPCSDDKVFIWKNKAGVTWELILTNMEENFGVLLLVFKVGEDCPYVQLGYTQARLFVREDKIEIEGPNGIYTKQN